MLHERTMKWIWALVGCTLMLVLLACAGPALLAHNGALPSFNASIQLWQGTTLVLHSTSAQACATAASCPYQIKIQPALSIWLISEGRRHETRETFGRRLLYIPAAEQ